MSSYRRKGYYLRKVVGLSYLPTGFVEGERLECGHSAPGLTKNKRRRCYSCGYKSWKGQAQGNEST